LEAVRAAGAAALVEPARASLVHTRGLAPAAHLPVIDLALPTMKAAAEEARQELIKALEAVVHADRRVSLHEFVVLTLVRSQLEPRRKGPLPGGKRLGELQAEAALVLRLVAHAGTRADAADKRAAAVQEALATGAAVLGIPPPAVDAAGLSFERVQA